MAQGREETEGERHWKRFALEYSKNNKDGNLPLLSEPANL